MLLLHLHRLARRLRPLLPLCFAAGCAGIALALFLLFNADDKPGAELLSFALGLSVWSLLLYAFIRLFQSIPPPVLPKDRWFERLWSRCRLAFYQLLALAVVVIALILVAMSLKLARSVAA